MPVLVTNAHCVHFVEKLNWIFNLYDIDRDGFISKSEMYLITNAIYEMLGKLNAKCPLAGLIDALHCTGNYTIPLNDIHNARQHVDRFFHVLIPIGLMRLLLTASFSLANRCGQGWTHFV